MSVLLELRPLRPDDFHDLYVVGSAAKVTKNFSQQKLTIGLDLGDRSSWYCLLDEVGEVLLEQKLGTTPKAMREVFGGMPRCRIALETGNALMEGVYTQNPRPEVNE